MLTKVEITHKTILFTLGILALCWILLQIADIILIIFLSFILMSAIRPAADKLEKMHLPRPIAIIFVYILLLLFVGVLGGSIFPPLITQTIKFWESVPVLLDRVLPSHPLNFDLLSQQITPLGGNLIKITFGFFSNIITLLTITVLSVYLLLERNNIEETSKSIFGQEKGERIVRVLWKIEERLGNWVRGQLVLMLIIGVFVYLGLLALGVEYALPLAITAGLLEIVPMVGSIISAVPAILVALVTSPVLALAVAAMYFIVNQSEGSLIAPAVMKKAVGLPAIVILIALMIGGKLAGIFGALLAVPMVLVLQVILQEITENKNA